MEKLDQILRQYNPYYNSYKRMYEVEKEEEEKAKANGTTITQVHMEFKRYSSDDPRRYNLSKGDGA